MTLSHCGQKYHPCKHAICNIVEKNKFYFSERKIPTNSSTKDDTNAEIDIPIVDMSKIMIGLYLLLCFRPNFIVSPVQNIDKGPTKAFFFIYKFGSVVIL